MNVSWGALKAMHHMQKIHNLYLSENLISEPEKIIKIQL